MGLEAEECKNGAGEMASSLKRLAHNHKELGTDVWYPCKKPGTRHPSTGEAGIGHPWAQSPAGVAKLVSSSCREKIKWKVIEDSHSSLVVFWPPYHIHT